MRRRRCLADQPIDPFYRQPAVVDASCQHNGPAVDLRAVVESDDAVAGIGTQADGVTADQEMGTEKPGLAVATPVSSAPDRPRGKPR